MSNTLASAEITDKAQRSLDRFKETFKVDDIPAGIQALAASETGIHDLYMNLKRQLDEGALSKADKYLVAIGVASAAGSAGALEFLSAAAREEGVDPQSIADAVAVATVCAVFNGYYKFRHLAPEGEFDNFKAPFNANSFMKSSLDTAKTEMICVAVSNYHSCNMCVTGHLAKARQAGVSDEQIDETIKATAVAMALAGAASSLG